MSVHSDVILDPPKSYIREQQQQNFYILESYTNLPTGVWITSLTIEVITSVLYKTFLTLLRASLYSANLFVET